MINEASQWNQSITENMNFKKIENKTIYTYNNLKINLYDSLSIVVKQNNEKIAIIDDFERKYSYLEFINMVDMFASYLYENGIKHGDHIAILLPTSIEYCVVVFALSKLGAISVLLPSKYKEQELSSLLSRSDSKLLIASNKYNSFFTDHDIETLFIDCNQDKYGLSKYKSNQKIKNLGSSFDDSLIIFTSGTTSMSKGVVLKNYNIMHSIETYKRIFSISSDDVLILPIPIYLVTGLIAILGLSIYSGATVCLNNIFNSKKVLSDVEKYKVTLIHASPAVFLLLLKEKNNLYDLSSLRILACGAGNMPANKIQELHSWIPNAQFRTIYGLTETSSPATIFPCSAFNHKYIGSAGIPIPGTEFKILDDSGKELLANNVGEIVIKGSVVLDSYYKLKTPKLKNDWLRTGDVGYFNKDGFIYITDRKKDMINRGGEKICSIDVENAIYNIEGIVETAVLGIKNELYGEIVIALVTIDPLYKNSINEVFIKEFLSKKIAKYEIPERIYFVNYIKKSENGKNR